MSVTLREVAEKVGVTPSIVSRVLNDKPVRVSDDTRQRIIEVADELNYRPDLYARVLQSGKSPMVILVAPRSFYLMNARKTARLQQTLRRTGHPLLTADIRLFDDPRAAIDLLLLTKPRAIVWLSPEWGDDSEFEEICSELHERETHVIAVDYQKQLPPDVPCDAITVDRAYGSYLACRHLIDCAGENVAMVGGSSGGRLQGYRRALSERGIDREIIGWLSTAEPPREAYQVTLGLLDDHPEIEGIFCYSDLNAMGVIKAIRETGRTIPDDICIAGYDDEPWTEFHDPPLTTVTHPIEQLCSLSLSVLQDRLDGNDEPWCRIGLHPALKIRASTAGREK
ncbi:MAG: LacI family DNA-binding transcriptional regulator [Armatimonadota bacterium]|nr:LacI family DNA-binding transcriptional regulator [Armatimonadota bacterium]